MRNVTQFIFGRLLQSLSLLISGNKRDVDCLKCFQLYVDVAYMLVELVSRVRAGATRRVPFPRIARVNCNFSRDTPLKAMAATVSASKRWTYFHSALQLAIQRSAHKWTCVTCFPHSSLSLPLSLSPSLPWVEQTRLTSCNRFLVPSQSYQDFAECFSLWCEEEPDASSSVCGTIANHLESSISVRT